MYTALLYSEERPINQQSNLFELRANKNSRIINLTAFHELMSKLNDCLNNPKLYASEKLQHDPFVRWAGGLGWLGQG